MAIELVGAYICLSVLLLLIFISSKFHFVFKSLLVALIVWYGLALYYTPRNLMGWPVATNNLPVNSIVISFRIQEPNTSNLGAVYFWLNTRPIQKNFTIMERLDPRVFFSYYGIKEPRAYKVPYTLKLHKTLLGIKRLQKGMAGSFIIVGKGKKGEENTKRIGMNKEDEEDDQTEFKIINPATILKKE